jgi:hypothetical protein
MGSKPGFFDLGFKAAYSRSPESTDLDAWGVSDVAPVLPGEPARVTGQDRDDLMVAEAGETYRANCGTAGVLLPSPAMRELPEKRRSRRRGARRAGSPADAARRARHNQGHTT